MTDAYQRAELLLDQWKRFTAYIKESDKLYEQSLYAVRKAVCTSALESYCSMLNEKNKTLKAEILSKAGLCNKLLGDYEAGIRFFQDANTLSPDCADILAEMADCYALCGQEKTAKVLFREAFFIEPQKVDNSFLESDINLPVLKGIPVSARDIDFDDPDGIDRFFREIYRYQVEHKARDFARVLHLMTDPAAFPLLYHCTNGKDRTGFMTALILLICGVPEPVILSDYTLSNLTFERAYESLGTIMATGFNMAAPEERAKLRDFFGVRPAWLKSQLDFIRGHFGDVDRYLTEQTDLASADLAAIRANLLAPAGDVV